MLAAWVLAVMLVLQPAKGTPWADGYEDTADAIAAAATAEPLYKGPHGVERTAALLVSLAWFESRFQPDAVGDHGQSVCLLQIGVSNLAELGVSSRTLLEDRGACLRTGLQMIRTSFAVCRLRPAVEQLGHYAAGGRTCGGRHGEGLSKSRHRVELAMRLIREHPRPALDGVD